MNSELLNTISEQVYRLLVGRHLVREDLQRLVFQVVPLEDRMVCIFNPAVVNGVALMQQRAELVRLLGQALGRRKVVFGVSPESAVCYAQIGYIPRQRQRLEMVALDLTAQPGALHLPIGTAATGPLWLPLSEMDSVLVGGTRRMGKTRLLHGFIQALLHGGQAYLWLWDGKDGVEFGRYSGRTEVNVVTNLAEAFGGIQAEMARRKDLFQIHGVSSLPEYRRATGEQLPALVLIVDEAAMVGADDQDALAKLIAIGGAFGVHPIVATQRPDAEAVKGLVRSNLATRIALPVPTHHESQIVLGRPGAERLPREPGWLLLEWGARLIRARAFRVELEEQRPGSVSRGSLMTADEQRVAAAVQSAGGWFRVKDIAQRSGVSERQVNLFAKRWERLGWLTPVQRDERGHTLGRRVASRTAFWRSVDLVDSVDLEVEA